MHAKIHLFKKKGVKDPKATVRISPDKYYARNRVAIETLDFNHGSQDLEHAVKRPKNFTREEWFFLLGRPTAFITPPEAVQTLDTLEEWWEELSGACFCKKTSAGERDGRAQSLSAKMYVDEVLHWARNSLYEEDEPSKHIEKIFSRVFRIYAHVFVLHSKDVVPSVEQGFRQLLAVANKFCFELAEERQMILKEVSNARTLFPQLELNVVLRKRSKTVSF